MRDTKGESSEFYCTECGHKGIPIFRKGNGYREPGHLKKLYCIYCQKETNHAEVRPFGNYTLDDFLDEFQYGNFVNGERITSYKNVRKEIERMR